MFLPNLGQALWLSPKQCTVGGDIASREVYIAAFVQMAVLLFMLPFGSFHSRATGSKEIGAGLIVTSVSLALALMIRAAGGLNPPNAAIVDGLTWVLSTRGKRDSGLADCLGHTGTSLWHR